MPSFIITYTYQYGAPGAVTRLSFLMKFLGVGLCF